MAVSSVALDFSIPVPQAEAEPQSWYGLQTRPRHEKMVVQRLEERGVATFLPLVKEVHRWSDRKKIVEMPLFSCYVFAKFMPNRTERLRMLRVDGVFGLVGSGGEGTPIPDLQIDAVRNLVETAAALVLASLPEDWSTGANSERCSRWHGRHPPFAQWRSNSRHFHRRNSTVPCGAG